ncbi:hypothetical protein ABTM36_19915, partial [Acinetobacter baumannii]
ATGRAPGAEPVSTGPRKQPTVENRLNVAATIGITKMTMLAPIIRPIRRNRLSRTCQNSGIPRPSIAQGIAPCSGNLHGVDDRQEFADQGKA